MNQAGGSGAIGISTLERVLVTATVEPRAEICPSDVKAGIGGAKSGIAGANAGIGGEYDGIGGAGAAIGSAT